MTDLIHWLWYNNMIHIPDLGHLVYRKIEIDRFRIHIKPILSIPLYSKRNLKKTIFL